MNNYTCNVCKKEIDLSCVHIHKANNNIEFIKCPHCGATLILSNTQFDAGSPFSQKELDAIQEFKVAHRDCYKNKGKVESFTIVQTATGIGENTTITCNCCGENMDVTDYDIW